MKVILSMHDEDVNGSIDMRFGRCSFFALVDTESGEASFIPNHEKDKGSGINAANIVLKTNPDAIIVGNIGPKAFQVLNRSGISVYEGLKNTVKETIQSFNQGELKKISSANK